MPRMTFNEAFGVGFNRTGKFDAFLPAGDEADPLLIDFVGQGEVREIGRFRTGKGLMGALMDGDMIVQLRDPDGNVLGEGSMERISVRIQTEAGYPPVKFSSGGSWVGVGTGTPVSEFTGDFPVVLGKNYTLAIWRKQGKVNARGEEQGIWVTAEFLKNKGIYPNGGPDRETHVPEPGAAVVKEPMSVTLYPDGTYKVG